ncbi:hypothetical protein [Mesorhizobium qingshengii]|uniref:Uncharacterized protein n=1 Tax=Mesorhizobium qingshengii TaxID=1165689 RepID=A0A1G5ZED5_9HYPH|nr:hypothetical protein [Mesorhizobium qingshengii]SDA92643.1 hypothetical protein SAMN02927914_04782 [Mesorhizobium qingshengii]
MKLGIPVYDGVNLLDVAGPLEMFSWIDKKKGLETVLLSIDGAPVTSLNRVRFDAQASFKLLQLHGHCPPAAKPPGPPSGTGQRWEAQSRHAVTSIATFARLTSRRPVHFDRCAQSAQ